MSGPLTLRSASSAAGVPPHGDGLLVLQDISEVGEGALELPAVDGLRSLARVLEGDAEVAAAGAGSLCAVEGLFSVANLPQLAVVVDAEHSGSAGGRRTYHVVVCCGC